MAECYLVQVIVTFIPSKTTVEELTRFVRSGLDSRFAFWKRSKIRRCEIMEVWDEEGRTREFHGLVSLSTHRDAERVIALLNGKTLNGKPVEVRKYFNRSPTDQRKKTRFLWSHNLYSDTRRPCLAISKRLEGKKQLRFMGQAEHKFHVDKGSEAPSTSPGESKRDSKSKWR